MSRRWPSSAEPPDEDDEDDLAPPCPLLVFQGTSSCESGRVEQAGDAWTRVPGGIHVFHSGQTHVCAQSCFSSWLPPKTAALDRPLAAAGITSTSF